MKFQSLARRQAGFVAQKRGKQFESFFESRCRIQNITCVRIPDGCRQLSATRTQRVRTPFDYIIGFKDQVAFVDLKSFDSDRIVYSQINPHQLQSLSELSKHAMAGYIAFFRQTKQIVFFDVASLKSCKPGGHISLVNGVLIGDLLRHDFGVVFRNPAIVPQLF